MRQCKVQKDLMASFRAALLCADQINDAVIFATSNTLFYFLEMTHHFAAALHNRALIE